MIFSCKFACPPKDEKYHGSLQPMIPPLLYVLSRPFTPHAGQKTQKLKLFAIGRFWLVGLVDRKMVVGISNSFYVVFGPLLAPIPNFKYIGQKTQKLKIFAIGRFWLVGLVGRKKVAVTSNIRNLFRGLLMTSVQNLYRNWIKIGQVSPS